MKKSLIVMGLFLVFIAACSSSQKKTEGTVLASVNGETLTMEELSYQIPEDYRNQLTPEALSEIIDNWINTEILYQKALEEGLDKDPEIEALVKAGTREAMARKYIDKELSSRVSISPTKIDSVYQDRKQSMKLQKDRFRVKHILVQTRDEAEAIYKRLRNGDDFTKLASDYSLDRRSADRGGDIGYFTADDLDPAFVKATKALKVGSFSKPVETPYGYHLILLTDVQRAGAVMDSLEAKRQIRDDLYATGHTKAFHDMLESLKASANIEKFPLTDSVMSKGTGVDLP